MYILGLNIGHNSTACLLKDGKIIGCVQEERFSRIKNHTGFPENSVKYLLNENKIDLKDINLVVMDNEYNLKDCLKVNPDIREDFFNAVTHNSINKKIKRFIGYHSMFIYRTYWKIYNSLRGKDKWVKNEEENKKEFSEIFNFSLKKIKVIPHHLSHAFSPCFNLNKDKKWIISTLDGEGGGLCASVNIWDGKELKVISKTKKESSLGGIYLGVTCYLGMRPLEHEFKVMGLAPYAKREKVEKLYNEKFKGLISINKNLEFESKFNMSFSDLFLQKNMAYERFDNISGAVQELTEKITEEWIKKAIKKTGIKNIALSGGVFMNVKTNQKIAEIPEVEKIFVMPSCGDESNAIGACFYGYKKYCEENNIKFNPQPIKDLYLGPEYGEEYIKELIKKEKLSEKYFIKKPKNINKEAAKLLAKGEIIARCSGKSEWGARALGNRSILANPKHKDTIRILNETIKDRDFWMPFTPSILDKYEKEYILNPKKIFSPYMVITFDSTEKAQEDLPAAMHPYDFTIRPQIVLKEWNSDYYEIIEEFSKLTGIGGILNTSFNLHGEPNVLTPEDALHTVENSSLKYLILRDYLFQKRIIKKN